MVEDAGPLWPCHGHFRPAGGVLFTVRFDTTGISYKYQCLNVKILQSDWYIKSERLLGGALCSAELPVRTLRSCPRDSFLGL